MITNSIQLLKNAREQRKCLAAFNVYNLESIRAVFEVGRKLDIPVIIAFGEGYLHHASLEVIAAIVHVMAKDYPNSVVLHLDHCKNLNVIKDAINAGFTSVMYDGSALPFSKNIENTKIAVNYAHSHGISIEGELGGLNPEDGSSSNASFVFTDPEQAEQYVAQTGIDSLAVSIGNAHGIYKGVPKLDFNRLESIYQQTKVPIVLHGCSGIPLNDLKTAISIAVSKINVNTEFALAGGLGVANALKDAQGKPVKLDILMVNAYREMVKSIEPFAELSI
jgi:tagatose 1,6-diphosphate aldolase GatY/KbaY